MLSRSQPLKGTGNGLRRSPLKKRGRMTNLWSDFAAAYAEECHQQSEDGLIGCQFGGCRKRLERPDLHHLVGRNENPSLYFEKTNLEWLCRFHHDMVHGS